MLPHWISFPLWYDSLDILWKEHYEDEDLSLRPLLHCIHSIRSLYANSLLFDWTLRKYLIVLGWYSISNKGLLLVDADVVGGMLEDCKDANKLVSWSNRFCNSWIIESWISIIGWWSAWQLLNNRFILLTTALD